MQSPLKRSARRHLIAYRLAQCSAHRWVKGERTLSGSLSFDPNTQVVSRSGKVLDIPETARRILQLLMRQSERFVSVQELEQWAWGKGGAPRTALPARMYELRIVINAPSEKPLLKSKRGVGYRLSAE